ncbi:MULTISPECIES: sensor histidine kinase [Emticicia]|uniref:sensor histidine kinase n=1 Tax=Emticicia TaxID=312278 RepID=UPI0007D8C4A6|nr:MULTISPECIES: histidine kinase [Emticicia]
MIKNPAIQRFIWGFSLLVAVFVNFPFIALQLPHLSIGQKPPHPNQFHAHKPPMLESQKMAGLDIFLQIFLCFLFAIIMIEVFRQYFLGKKSKQIWYFLLLLVVFITSLGGLNFFVIGIHASMMFVTVAIRGVLILGIAYVFSKFLVENEQKSEILLENEHLKNENLLVQLSALKNQLNPHFLFNSLNTLSWLINEDKEKSQRYLQKLSQVLRYSLSMQEQSLVPLKEELALLENYIFLLQIRFGDNLKIVRNIGDIPFKIPPLSLQLLIENVIKHNVISTASPMKIWVEMNENKKTIIVKNTLNRKINSEGTGIGLVNLNERFKILASQEVEIEQNEKEFTVILPLI